MLLQFDSLDLLDFASLMTVSGESDGKCIGALSEPRFYLQQEVKDWKCRSTYGEAEDYGSRLVSL